MLMLTEPHFDDGPIAMADAPFDTPDARWQAVASRDRRADGVFVFAVRTTGIYCRPSCPARTAKRTNMVFLDSPEEARRQGFRPCKRCRPDDAAGDTLEVQAVTAAARLIDRAVETGEPVPPLQALADRAGFSKYHFHRMFKGALGVTPKAYEAALRSRRMTAALTDDASVTEAIYDAGYSSSSRFYETATARLGMAPKAHRRGGAGEHIRYALATCSLGLVLVATTDRGVCAIQFGDDRAALVEGLKARFANAILVAGDDGFADLVDRVVALVERPGIGHDLPLDLRGTAFQERVWQALRAIPAGQTASYAEVAQAIGAPRAARGVARACSANPAAVAVPCHRVVGSDGDLRGYRWGLDRKAKLLAREGGR